MQYNVGGEEKQENAVDEGYKCQMKGTRGQKCKRGWDRQAAATG